MAERIVQQPVATERQKHFSELPSAEVERSTFDMSYSWKGTHQTNRIVPILLQEVLPGDTFNVKTTAFSRLATPLKPIYDNLTADIHYFFVPTRLVWDHWQNFMGERDDIDDDPAELSVPQLNIDLDVQLQTQNLADYFGLPLYDQRNVDIQVNTLPFRGYELIWNDWYRNESLTSKTTVPKDDGPDNPSIFGLGFIKTRHKRADYFTRALPWPQKGDPVFLPLGTNAPVVGIGVSGAADFTASNVQVYETGMETGDGPKTYVRASELGSDANDLYLQGAGAAGRENYPSIFADLTKATAATINDIRTAFQIQRLLERDARGGTRYISILLSHFNVQSPDFRLQRPEFLGSGSGRITINPVASTTAYTDGEQQVPQGNLSAVATGVVKAGFNHSFTEHGYLFGLMSCRADLTYQNGMDRIWTRKTRYDYYWPALSHLGEQQILNREIWFNPDDIGPDSSNQETWGFQERYAEYRYNPGRITGKFRSADPESLDVWHLAQDFEELPLLDTPFLLEDPPIERIVAVPSEPDLLTDVWHEIKATRPMPIYAVPGMVDHF